MINEHVPVSMKGEEKDYIKGERKNESIFNFTKCTRGRNSRRSTSLNEACPKSDDIRLMQGFHELMDGATAGHLRMQ